ncbi:hypothetical protein FA95DRAFT_1504736 [Auriscalpium vulgare]|uniref:Uncharacterized protein n=1 Tax=Auriscalpium vulgare TaxID=40419 RepID=A0ACB8R4H8_9AGAM|nr:hypothetical protein FA95DRAFT_1504736 [Auriscalpium vulgare]
MEQDDAGVLQAGHREIVEGQALDHPGGDEEHGNGAIEGPPDDEEDEEDGDIPADALAALALDGVPAVRRPRATPPLPEDNDRGVEEDHAERLDDAPGDHALWDDPFIVAFPGGTAGAPVGQDVHSGYNEYGQDVDQDQANEYHPFPSKMAWEVARWAKLRGPTSTALTDLLSIDGVSDALDLPFKNANELNSIIDNQLPRRPAFKHDRIEVGGEKFDFYYRDALECIKALYGDPEFAPYMAFAPERHYSDADQTIRVYNQMHTGKWWWRVQRLLEAMQAGATVVPLIVSTDATQLTLFRNKSAYPIYLTIGNIPKEIRRKPSRRAQILLGYLPTSRLSHIKNKDTRRLALANMFHACMRKILRALAEAGLHGVQMASGDGVVRRCHPVLACYVGDYPEQCRVVGCKNMDCPKACITEKGDLGEWMEFDKRNIEDVLAALDTADQGPQAYLAACAAVGIKPIDKPFWIDLPFVNIYEAITPDVLHQQYQGMVKHVIAWLKKAFVEAEIDARFARMPPNHNLRLFSSGISHMSRVSGQEHKDICRVLLGVIADLRLPNGASAAPIIRAVRALLDFVYVAQYPTHSTTTLAYLDNALARFHQDKEAFYLAGAVHSFELPKLHSMLHYSHAIKLFGTTDNYNTEYSERLHIDLAKDAYRATNHKDEYPQMTKWLQRKEKIMRHDLFIKWRLSGMPAIGELERAQVPRQLRLKLTRRPTVKAVSFANVEARYGAEMFRNALARYITQWNHPTWTAARVSRVAADYTFSFASVAAFHKVKFWHPDAQGRDDVPQILDCIYARPKYRDTQRRLQDGRFDTALVDDREVDDDESPIHGFRAVQVRIVFSLSQTAVDTTFKSDDPARTPPEHLAYVEWFSRFRPVADANHSMYRVSRAIERGERVVSIVPVSRLKRSVHMIPVFGAEVPRDWKSSTVLDRAAQFYLNCFTDRTTYITLY